MTPLQRAKALVAQYYNRRVDKSGGLMITSKQVKVVWFCYTLGNWKALLIEDRPNDFYYEVTHNHEKAETYIDVYRKLENLVVQDGDDLHEFATRELPDEGLEDPDAVIMEDPYWDKKEG